MSTRRSARGSTKGAEEETQKDAIAENAPVDPSAASQTASPEEGKPKISKRKKEILDGHKTEELQDIAHILRLHAINMTNASKSGHPTSCSSMAELMSVLFFDKSGLHYDHKNPKESFNSDRFVLSKGHAAPILWAAWAENGYFKKEQLLTLRKIDSDLEGHPTPRIPFVDVATGSLGQGLAVASGMAYSSKNIDKINNHYWCLLGDGECAQGSVWEAANFAGFYKLNNLTAIVDLNRLGQSEETQVQHNTKLVEERWASFGWNVRKIDGHNIVEIIDAFENSRNQRDKPTVVIAKTFKGQYFPNIEDKLDWHGKPVGDKDVYTSIEALIKNKDVKLEPTGPDASDFKPSDGEALQIGELKYEKGQKIATRQTYGDALVALGKNDPHRRIVVLDGDTQNSTFSITFKQEFPNNFIECFIAEQLLVGVSTGFGCRQHIPFCSTFACFFTRAYDQIRMGAISHANLKLVGSHSGVSIGEDGPSQMALEDFAMMRAIPNAVVLYPSDAVSTSRAVELAANFKGIVYIRTSRPETVVVFDNDEHFDIGLSQVIRKSDKDKLCVVTGGVTLGETIKAADRLKADGIDIQIVDIFSIKPVDKQTLQEAALTSNNLILTVEDHYKEGGIFDAVTSAVIELGNVKVFGIAVDSVPRSGTPEELLAFYKLDEKGIYDRVRSLIQ